MRKTMYRNSMITWEYNIVKNEYRDAKLHEMRLSRICCGVHIEGVMILMQGTGICGWS